MNFQLVVAFLVALFFSLTSNAATLDSVVYDTDGHVLIPGEEYYILPVIRGRGGGLTVTQHNDEICPLYVAQENMELDNGQPWIFHPTNPRDSFIHTSTDINIVFQLITVCMEGEGWQLGHAEEADHKRYIIIRGSTGNPGCETMNNWFKIEKWENSDYNDYKLVFCPSVCETCKVDCGDVGIFYEDEKRLLGLGGDIFPVMFKKVDSEN